MTTRRAELQRIAEDFTACFERVDLDGLMDFFADDAVYEEVNGPVNRGKAAIRQAFAPLFSGAFGHVRFTPRDFFLDTEQDKVMASWDCHLVMDGVPKVLEGLDTYVFRGDRIVFKRAYCKARQPRYVDETGG